MARGSLIVQSSTSPSVQCRCGTRIPAGGVVFGVTTESLSSEDLFRQRQFCSVRCIRAFCLESLETLAALDTPSSKSLISDVQECYREVSEILTTLPDT